MLKSLLLESPAVVSDLNEDILFEELRSQGIIHRRDSYHQAIRHTEYVPQPTHFTEEPTSSADIEEMQQYILDTVSEGEELDVHDSLKEPIFLAEATVKQDEGINSLEGSLDEIIEYEKEADTKDASSTRADILDTESEDLDATLTEEPPVAQWADASHSSASVGDDLTVGEQVDEISDFPQESVRDELDNSRAPDVPSSSPQHDAEDVVWISQTVSDIQPQDGTVELEQQDSQIQEHDLPVCILPTKVDQSANECSSIRKLSPSPPPPPPIDVIAIDLTGQLLSHDLRDNVEVDQSIANDEYCHSPLGGAMPESDDSDAGEFVFP